MHTKTLLNKRSRYRPAQAIEAERVQVHASGRVNARAGYLKVTGQE